MKHVQSRPETGPVTATTSAIEAQYSRGDLRARITNALHAAGKDPDRLSINDLDLMDEFHLRGRAATTDLADLAAIQAEDHLLDIGAGLGGPARLLAQTYGCHVTTVDLSADYCETAEWLNSATGLSERITVLHADALNLPFPDGSFDVVWSQHAQMNIADKRRFYREGRRVLKTAAASPSGTSSRDRFNQSTSPSPGPTPPTSASSPKATNSARSWRKPDSK